MPLSIDQTPLFRIANPEHIAVFGASNRFLSMGTNLLSSILSLGFKGEIFPVHPTEDPVMGLKGYKSVADLPKVPDLALIVLPTNLVPGVLEDCGKKGIRHAIIVSGGFQEVGGEGPMLQRQICEIAEKYKIRFLGPNCIGVANPYHRFNATFLPYPQGPGFIGLASQSGSFVTQMFDYLAQFGQGFSTAFSVGNEANLDIVDCLSYLGACSHTQVIGLYIEAIRRGRAFIETARAIVPHKPIVAYYAGGSEAGRKAGFSHTGALSGPDRLYEGIFRQSGVIRAQSIEELFDFCWCLEACPRPSGNRVIIQTHSGGPGAVAAEACGREGLVLAPISEETRQKLMPYVPHTGSVNNPVDITFSKRTDHYYLKIPKILLDDADSDAVLCYLLMPEKSVRRAMEGYGITGDKALEESGKYMDTQSRALADLITSHSKPCIGFSFYTRENRFVRGLQDKGVVVLPSPTRAARALSALVRYVRFCEKIRRSESSEKIRFTA